jgi:hypothetical protein
MTKNLLFVQTGEEYFQEITNLTQEIKKLAQFKHMVEHKIILPIGELARMLTSANISVSLRSFFLFLVCPFYSLL